MYLIAHYRVCDYAHRACTFGVINFGNLVKNSPIRQFKKSLQKVSGSTIVQEENTNSVCQIRVPRLYNDTCHAGMLPSHAAILKQLCGEIHFGHTLYYTPKPSELPSQDSRKSRILIIVIDNIIGASLSEPHTSVTALAEVVCIYV